jgi:putative SOS response-associated peptidase YedK
MCGRYTLATTTPAQLRERFPVGESVQIATRYNVAPGDDVVCVTTDKDGAPRGELLRWGLVPHWAKDTKDAFKRINARVETLSERPAYRDALKTHRCLVIADGFYEWQPLAGKAKQPWWITRADHAPFAFAGLWSTWRAPDSSQLRTMTIVTTEAVGTLRDLHHRAPVILEPGAEVAWLDHATTPAELPSLLAGIDQRHTATRAVGTAVNDARYDGPACLDVPEEPAAAQLF